MEWTARQDWTEHEGWGAKTCTEGGQDFDRSEAVYSWWGGGPQWAYTTQIAAEPKCCTLQTAVQPYYAY